MCGLFSKKPPIHEPIEKQIEDVKKYYPMLADKILNGLNCDSIPKAKGPFGSINNPIPVNSAIGQIKYLGKLRGKTGQAVFFHRLRSCSSEVTDNLVDMYELVCLDGTQWSLLYFDLYHPRRSNMSPEGFTLMPYNEKIKMDIPFAFGVDYFVENFPHGLPVELEKFGGDAFSRRAKERLSKYKFENPNLKDIENQKGTQNKKSNIETKIESPKSSPSDIRHFDFISGVINEILEYEKQEIPKIKSPLSKFQCPVLSDENSHVKLMIERYLYLSSLIKHFGLEMNLSDMNQYVNSISIEEYKLSASNSKKFMDQRIAFYSRELEMLKKFKHPHPGKIVWSLYNPSPKERTDDVNSMFESDLIAGLQMLGVINETFKAEFKNYSDSNKVENKKTPKDEAISYYFKGLSLEKEGEYEEALDLYYKAKAIRKDINGLSAHILISKFWLAEFELEDQFESLFDSFTEEIKNNPTMIELYETRAWLCYHILGNILELEEKQRTFYGQQCEIDFSFCISKDPNNMRYYGSRSLFYTEVHEYDKALNDINKAIELAPSKSRHYKERAIIYRNLGQLKNSLLDIEKAISLCEDDRWRREYTNLKDSLLQDFEKQKKEKKIDSQILKISVSSKLKINDIISSFEAPGEKKGDYIEYMIINIEGRNISLKKMAVNGEPLKNNLRASIHFSFESLIENKFNLLADNTNDRDTWPRNLIEAVKELVKLYDDKELHHISNLTWSQFQMEYNTVGGLDQWVRNHFGLWRGNYDLMLDSKIDKINADNASLSILYHFWEFVVDNFKK